MQEDLYLGVICDEMPKFALKNEHGKHETNHLVMWESPKMLKADTGDVM